MYLIAVCSIWTHSYSSRRGKMVYRENRSLKQIFIFKKILFNGEGENKWYMDQNRYLQIEIIVLIMFLLGCVLQTCFLYFVFGNGVLFLHWWVSVSDKIPYDYSLLVTAQSLVRCEYLWRLFLFWLALILVALLRIRFTGDLHSW